MKELTIKERNVYYNIALNLYDSKPYMGWERKLCAGLYYAKNKIHSYIDIHEFPELLLFAPEEDAQYDQWYDNVKDWDGSKTNPENDNIRKDILMLCIEMTKTKNYE